MGFDESLPLATLRKEESKNSRAYALLFNSEYNAETMARHTEDNLRRFLFLGCIIDTSLYYDYVLFYYNEDE